MDLLIHDQRDTQIFYLAAIEAEELHFSKESNSQQFFHFPSEMQHSIGFAYLHTHYVFLEGQCPSIIHRQFLPASIVKLTASPEVKSFVAEHPTDSLGIPCVPVANTVVPVLVNEFRILIAARYQRRATFGVAFLD